MDIKVKDFFVVIISIIIGVGCILSDIIYRKAEQNVIKLFYLDLYKILINFFIKVII